MRNSFICLVAGTSTHRSVVKFFFFGALLESAASNCCVAHHSYNNCVGYATNNIELLRIWVRPVFLQKRRRSSICRS